MNRTTAFWVVTGLFCLAFTMGGTMHLLRAEQMAEGMRTLGYPAYVMTILGTAKLLGVVALLVPGRLILKEWAYAGFTFDLLGAAASHVFVGDPISETLKPLVLLGIGVASYQLRPASRRLA
jgi:uncharacterized membrane protein